MPFTLAHPAAILPLRRLCPRYLSLAGLVIGSIVPDIGYLFTPWNGGDFSHTFVGSLLFCLPVGVMMLVLFYGFQVKVVNMLPEQSRRLFQPFCRKPIPHPLSIVISLLIGVWLHQFWDACTHGDSWVTMHIPLLNQPMTTIGLHIILYCHLLLYISSFVGVAYLYAAYDKWRSKAGSTIILASRGKRWLWALLIAALTIPLEIIHHVMGTLLVFATVGVASLLLVIGVALNLEQTVKLPQKPARARRTVRYRR